MNKKVTITIHISLAVLLASLLLVASFYDYSFSQYLYNENWFSTLGAVIGKMPAWLFAMLGGSILFANAFNRQKDYRFKTTYKLIYAVMTIAVGILLIYSLVDDIIVGGIKYLIALILGGGIATLSLILMIRVKPETIKMLKKWAILAIICVLIVALVTTATKLVWGRGRYLDIVIGNADFTKWFIPQGLTGGTSMPSGHVALGSCIFLLVPMFKCCPKLEKYSLLAFIGSVIYFIVIGLSRIIGGSHFLSDVLISLMIAYITIFIGSWIMFGADYSKKEFLANKLFDRL